MASSKTNGTAPSAPKAPKTEAQKREAFKTKGAKATNRVLKALDGLSRIARPASYTWTDAEVQKILSACAGALRNVEARFQNPTKRAEGGFTL